MLHGEPLDRAVVVQYVDGAPVGQSGHREAGHVGQRGPVVERGGERRTALGQKAEHVVCVLALTNVLHKHRKTPEASVSILEGGDEHARPERGAVLADPRPFLLVPAFGQCRPQFLLRVAGRIFFAGVEDREGTAQDLRRTITLHALGALVPGRHASFRIEHEVGVVLDALDHEPEALLALAQVLLMALCLQLIALGPIPRRAQRGRQHAHQHPFEHEGGQVQELGAEGREGNLRVARALRPVARSPGPRPPYQALTMMAPRMSRNGVSCVVSGSSSSLTSTATPTMSAATP